MLYSPSYAGWNPYVVGITATAVPPQTPTLSYDAEGTAAGNLLVTSEATTISQSGVSFSTSGAALHDSADYLRLTATNGNNINFSEFTIEFTYQATGTVDGWDMLISGSGTQPLSLYRRSTDETNVGATLCGTTVSSWAIGVNIFDGSLHTVKFSGNAAAGTLKIKVDGGAIQTQSGLSITCSSPAFDDNWMYLCSNGSIGSQCNGTIHDVVIYDTDNL